MKSQEAAKIYSAMTPLQRLELLNSIADTSDNWNVLYRTMLEIIAASEPRHDGAKGNA
tara:strand:- start:3458 stop:3631 length:174 start_codon:yes stop_codon:yes gene_type:complete